MKLVGLHHITMITGNAQQNVDFYADVLGLRLVKKTVNFDDPTAYHLYFGDEQRRARLDPDLVRVPGSAPRAGRRRDDPHDPARRPLWRGARLLGRPACRARTTTPGGKRHRCASPTGKGLALELVIADEANPPLRAVHPQIPTEFAIVGLEGARAYAPYAERRGDGSHGEAGFQLRGRRPVSARRQPAAVPLGL